MRRRGKIMLGSVLAALVGGALLFTSTALGLVFGFLLAGSLAVLADWRMCNPESWSDFEHSLGRARSDVRSAMGVRRAG